MFALLLGQFRFYTYESQPGDSARVQAIAGVFAVARKLLATCYAFTVLGMLVYAAACFLWIVAASVVDPSKNLLVTTSAVLVIVMIKCLTPPSPPPLHACTHAHAYTLTLATL